jgi:hypothetical protein
MVILAAAACLGTWQQPLSGVPLTRPRSTSVTVGGRGRRRLRRSPGRVGHRRLGPTRSPRRQAISHRATQLSLSADIPTRTLPRHPGPGLAGTGRRHPGPAPVTRTVTDGPGRRRSATRRVQVPLKPPSQRRRAGPGGGRGAARPLRSRRSAPGRVRGPAGGRAAAPLCRQAGGRTDCPPGRSSPQHPAGP